MQGPSTILQLREKIETIPLCVLVRGNVSTRENILFVIRLVTGGVFGVASYLLLFGPPIFFGLLSVTLLWFVYFVYVISGVMLLHFIIFRWEAVLAERGRHLSKRFPKYLEYAYTVIVAASLLQIFVFAPRMADYVTWLQGDENYVGNKIKSVAQSYLENECTHRGTADIYEYSPRETKRVPATTYFTAEYCAKLNKIINAPDVIEYVLKSVVTDPAFFIAVVVELNLSDLPSPPDVSQTIK
jgi:hypothetical protein